MVVRASFECKNAPKNYSFQGLNSGAIFDLEGITYAKTNKRLYFII